MTPRALWTVDAMVEAMGAERQGALAPSVSGVSIDSRTIVAGDAVEPRVPEAFTGLNRIPILMLGPLLHQTGEAFVPLVGGDPIGRRPVDFHVEALTALGAEIEHGPKGLTAKAAKLRGARITLPYPSVGATETVLLSAVLADGKTVLRNAATEPEVVELALFLQRMGANFELSPDRRIVIEGVEKLSGAEHDFAEDFHEIATFMALGAVTGGEVAVRNARPDQFPLIDRTFAKLGVQVTHENGWSRATRDGVMRVKKPFTQNILTKIEAAPWPYLPVDLLPSFALAARGKRLDRLAEAFRRLPVPVIGRIEDDTLLFDLRTLDDEAGFAAQLAGLAP